MHILVLRYDYGCRITRLAVLVLRVRRALRRFVESSTSRLVYQTKTRILSYDIGHADDAL